MDPEVDGTGILRVEVEGRQVRLTGELDVEGVQALREAVTSAGAGAAIDMAGVTFIDSSGIRAVLRCTQEAPGAIVVNPSPTARRIFELTGLGYLVDDEAHTEPPRLAPKVDELADTFAPLPDRNGDDR